MNGIIFWNSIAHYVVHLFRVIINIIFRSRLNRITHDGSTICTLDAIFSEKRRLYYTRRWWLACDNITFGRTSNSGENGDSFLPLYLPNNRSRFTIYCWNRHFIAVDVVHVHSVIVQIILYIFCTRRFYFDHTSLCFMRVEHATLIV